MTEGTSDGGKAGLGEGGEVAGVGWDGCWLLPLVGLGGS